MRNSFTYGGRASTYFNVWINGLGSITGALPDVTKVKVPGRNGEIIFSNDSYNNVSIEYKCFIFRDFMNSYQRFKEFLYRQGNRYVRLVDTYHPGYYREARLANELKAEDIVWNNNQGFFSVVFDCKPQLFLDSGDEHIEITTSGTTIQNPTNFPAKPILHVYGYGTLIIGDSLITIINYTSGGTDHITIDCDICEAYSGINGMNSYIQADKFPVLEGNTSIIFTGGNISKVEVVPRWWTI